VLIIAPVGQDAAAMANLLKAQGFEAQTCDEPVECARKLAEGGGVLLLTEEALALPHAAALLDTLKAQPPWSELPLIILTRGGESRLSKLLDLAESAAGGVTLLERPIGGATLTQSVQVALRSRRRQYQVRDLIEEQKRKQQQLRESEERYRTLVSQIKNYAIFRTDTEGRPTSWNEGVRQVLGFAEEEFTGRDIRAAIFTPEDLKAGVPERELEVATTEGTASNDRWMRRKDGSRFFASGITTALRDESGRVIGFSKVLRDVTDKRQASEKLERTVAERTADLRETNEQLEAFVYSIAHDLRAPLRSMTGFSQLLMADHASGLDEPGQQMLKRITASSEFMDKLLVDLLAYGRTARAELELGPVDVKKAWDAALLQCALQIEQSDARIETECPLPTVRAHEATLGQILANLLSNALKFVARGVRPHVRFHGEEQGTFVRLWVEDNGIGIPADQHERVFRVFERLHGSRYMGTGIGLSIVRKGTERMGGAVGVISEPAKGSRFWIELPKVT
jgi:PAS domain S-box-containing protein